MPSLEARSPKRPFRKLLRSVLEEDRLTIARSPTAEELAAFTGEEPTAEILARELTAGAPAPDAVVASVRGLARRQGLGQARLIMRAARGIGPLNEAARAAAAVIAVEYGRLAKAEEQLQGLPRATAVRLALPELVAVELAAGEASAIAACEAALATSEGRDPGIWLDLARHTTAYGELELAMRVLERIQNEAGPVAPDVDSERRWLERWIERMRAGTRTAARPADGVAVAVLDYQFPDYRRTSANVGDYIQTLASIGHLVRRPGVRFRGDANLVAELSALQARVPAARELAEGEGDVTLVAVNRDASTLDEVPEGTWMLAFGWYMHGWFRTHYDLPFHPNLRPLFISFHVNRPEALSAQAVDYLREHAPIGCRDWTTVRRLQALDVPAFFSGCLTTTVDLLFGPGPEPGPDAPVALVEVRGGGEHELDPGERGVVLAHSSLEIRGAPLAANLVRAAEQLDGYRSAYRRVETSRLHCYLPARALGVEVRFRPHAEDDIRFDGLIEIDDAAFAAMQRGICDKLQAALDSILRGDDEDAVRAAWQEACAADVEAASAAQTRSI